MGLPSGNPIIEGVTSCTLLVQCIAEFDFWNFSCLLALSWFDRMSIVAHQYSLWIQKHTQKVRLLTGLIIFLLQTVDQLFALRVPMRSAELNSLIRGIDNAFQLYAQHVVSKLGMYVEAEFLLMLYVIFNHKTVFNNAILISQITQN